jgi:hypothetical protein
MKRMVADGNQKHCQADPPPLLSSQVASILGLKNVKVVKNTVSVT